jgi:glucose/arabinose dehydrogenase/fibronectin type 3 domain-containing protein/regulation of enolase protein 1 (concanavalin A-like superfamily)
LLEVTAGVPKWLTKKDKCDPGHGSSSARLEMEFDMGSRWLPALTDRLGTTRTAWLAALALALLAPGAGATTFAESGFTETSVASPRANGSWSEAVGLTFSTSGRMFVWERGGRVWIVDAANPVTQPFLDISPEVLGWRDHGFLGFALHPDFDNTGLVYLMYTVDRNHLMNCDSPTNGAPTCNGSYLAADTWFPNQQFLDAPANTRPNPGYNKATIGRIIRLQAVKPVGDADYRRASTVDYASRKVLLGETFAGQPKSGGIPLTHESHGVGSLAFGQDGTLLVTTGDNASYTSTDGGSAGETYWQSAIDDGIMPAKENVGAFRSQMVDSLAGKVLRLDPDTGNGLPSNPFYDGAAPRAAKSRVWALGLRNPYRMAFRPGTGDHLPQQGNPGSFYIGDVGYVTWEDLHVLRTSRENFGWPLFEGQTPNTAYQNRETQNPDAPNPLAGGSCPPFFKFEDLIKQETTGSLSFPNPCNAGQQVPLAIDVFEHTRPALDWQHGVNNARWGSFDGSGNAVAVTLGQTYNGKTISGTPFSGNASTGGVWYQGTDFPSQYRNTYFQGDYGGQWIRNFVFDSNDNLTEVRNFATATGGVVALATHPVNGNLYYIEWASFVRKVTFNATKPVALAAANPAFGNSPLQVSFSGAASFDPQGQPLSYLWDFGDGTTSTAANPTKTYTLAPGQTQNFTASLTVTDAQALTDQAFVTVAVNNTPPQVDITSPSDGGTYSVEVGNPTSVNLNALISDAESPPGQLFCAWTVILNHNNHTHQDPAITDCTSAVVLTPIGCDGETYSYTLRLDVTDPQGLTGTDSVTLQPACTGSPSDTAAPAVPGTPTAQAIASNRIDLAWGGSTDTGGSGLAGYRLYRNGGTTPIAIVTSPGFSDQNLTPGTTYTYRVSAFDGAGNQSAQSATASITTLQPPAWTSQDIGATGATGSFNDGGATQSLSGAGNDIWGTSDQFRFAYQTLSGDGEIVARVVSITNTDAWAKAGVMFRESVAANSRFAMMLMTPGANGAAFQYRVNNGGSAAPSGSADRVSTLPRWVRLTRQGNLIRGFTSVDGVTWIQRNSFTIPFPQTILVGLAHTSSITGLLGTAVFDNVAVIRPAPDATAPDVPAGLAATAASQARIDLAWSAATDTGGSGLAGYRVYRNAGTTPHATVTAPATTYADTGLVANTTYTYRVTAFDAAGNESALSAQAGATTLDVPPPDGIAPSAPTGLTAAAVAPTRVNLAWSAATDTGGSGLAGYRVYRNGSATPLATVPGTSYADTTVVANTAYSYQVSAIDGAGNESALSAGANATTPATSPWSNQDIGAVAAAGSYVDNDGSIAVTGSGADIWRSQDEFHFVHRTLTGDGEILARVVSLSNTDPFAKAGVMFRESLTANSRFAMMIMTPGSNGAAFQYRTSTGGSAGPSGSNDLVSTLPRWVRVVREGNVFRGFISTDGVSWTLRNSITIAMPATVYVGLAMTSHNDGVLGTAVFDGVAVTLPAPDTAAPSVPGTPTGSTPGPTQVNLGWAPSTDTGGSGLAGYRVYRNGGATPHATVTTPAYADSGLTANTGYTYRVSAFDVAGNESALSAPVTVTTPDAPPPDGTPPTVPGSLTANAISSGRIDLAWQASADTGSGVAGYRVYRNGGTTPVGSPTGTTFADTGLTPVTAYTYQVSAVDVAGNESALSATAGATTLAPTSWTNQDIGGVAAPGSFTDNGASLAVAGSGADIWGTSDEFHFAHRTLTGNGEIIARVTGLTNTDLNAKAGVMMRSSLAANSQFALMLMTPSTRGAAFQRRLTTGGSAGPSSSVDNVSTLPRWVRLVRQGNDFRGFVSADGQTWTLRNSATIAMPATVFVGLAVTSHNDGVLATGTFDNVSVIAAPSDSTPPTVPAGLAGTAERRSALLPVTTVGAGLKPHSIATGDLNNDGFVDIVTGNSDSNDASVLLGNGSGGFALASSPTVGLKPKTLGLGDVNKDGIPDLVVGNQDSNNLSILLGNGNGTYQAAVNYAACPRPHELAIGDFNEDSWPDVAVACQFNTSVVGVFINNGTGAYQPMVSYVAGSRPHSVVTADFNQDGHLDLAVANYAESTIGILAGNGNGTFGTSVKYASGGRPHSLRTADLNGDGRLDLVAVNDNTNTASVLLGLAGGLFAARTDYAVGSVPKGVALGDIDGDGIVDIVSANTGGSYPTCCVATGGDNVSVLSGRGDGTFDPRYEHTVGRTPFAAEVRDVNGDGRNDVVTANYDDTNVGLSFGGPGQHRVRLQWAAATDAGVGVAGYRVFRNGQPVGTSTATTFIDQGLAAATTYQYSVSAFDAASPANESAPSAAIPVTTLPNN